VRDESIRVTPSNCDSFNIHLIQCDYDISDTAKSQNDPAVQPWKHPIPRVNV
jgi:hypothetical protein